MTNKIEKILIIYSTTDGHTIEICQHIQKLMTDTHHQVTILNLIDNLNLDINSYDKIIIGASIRYGKHAPIVTEFINKNVNILNKKLNSFFSVNVVARKSEKNTPETNPYLIKFLKSITWKPKHLAVFAGKIDYPRYTFFDRQMIRLIMWMTKGPTDKNAVIEFTDWQRVDEFALLMRNM